MKIKTRMQVNAYVSMGMSIIIALLFLFNMYQMKKENEWNKKMKAISTVVFQLNLVADDYFKYHHKRPLLQWQIKNDHLTNLLTTLSFKTRENQESIELLNRTSEETKTLFTKMRETYELGKSHKTVTNNLLTLEARLSTQLTIKLYNMMVISDRMRDESYDRIQTAQQRNTLLVMLLLVAMVSFIVFNSIMVRKTVVGPITKLREGSRIVAGGNLDYNVEITGDDEICELSRDFNEMTFKLKTSHPTLRAEIEERKRAQESLVIANKELEAFSYSVSHDLRAPLRHIIGYSELLREVAVNPDEKSRSYLNNILESAQRMGDLIDDLLSFSRMGRVEMQKRTINTEQLVKDVINDLSNQTKDRNIVWNIAELPNVHGDPAMLQLVFTNLFSNAIKFTRPCDHAQIDIGSNVSGNSETIFFVRDNGVGFDMKYADQLFGVFQRLHSIHDFEGTGIGLANVKRIVLRHSGRVWAEGTVNGGATFHFSLPN